MAILSPSASPAHFSPPAGSSPSASSANSPSVGNAGGRGVSPSATTGNKFGVSSGSGQLGNLPPWLVFENSLIPILCGLFSLLSHPSHHVKKEVALLVRFVVQHRPHLLRPVLHYFLYYVSTHPTSYTSVTVPSVYTVSPSTPAPVAQWLASFVQFTTTLLNLFVVDQALVHTVQVGQLRHVNDEGLPLRFTAYEAVEKLLEKLTSPLSLHSRVSGAAAVVSVNQASSSSSSPSASASAASGSAGGSGPSSSSSQFLTVSSCPLFDYTHLFNSICINGLQDEDDIVRKSCALINLLVRGHPGAVQTFLYIILPGFDRILSKKINVGQDENEKARDLDKKRAVTQSVILLDNENAIHFHPDFYALYKKHYLTGGASTQLQELMSKLRKAEKKGE